MVVIVRVTTNGDAAVAALAVRQHGVFSRAQAEELGLSETQRVKRVSSGRWESPHRGVYRIAGSPESWEAKVMGACLAAGWSGRASHRSAAVIHGLPGGTRNVVEITCRRWRRARHDELVVHESSGFDEGDTTTCSAIPVTSVAVTLLDLGSVVHEHVVEQAVDVAVRRGSVTVAELEATLQRLGRRGRDGTAALRATVDARGPTLGRTESPAETTMRRMLVRNGLPEPELQFVVRDRGVFLARVDAAYPRWRIAVEYESYEFHDSRRAQVRDSHRRNLLLTAGWRYVSVTADDLRGGGFQVARTIRSLMHTEH